MTFDMFVIFHDFSMIFHDHKFFHNFPWLSMTVGTLSWPGIFKMKFQDFKGFSRFCRDSALGNTYWFSSLLRYSFITALSMPISTTLVFVLKLGFAVDFLAHILEAVFCLFSGGMWGKAVDLRAVFFLFTPLDGLISSRVGSVPLEHSVSMGVVTVGAMLAKCAGNLMECTWN